MSVELLEGISCRNCPGSACCRDIGMILNGEEIKNLRKAGSKLKILGSFGRKGGDQKEVRLEGPCGNLTEDSSCAVHGTDLQPLVCKAFPMKGSGCIQRREKMLRGPLELPLAKE